MEKSSVDQSTVQRAQKATARLEGLSHHQAAVAPKTRFPAGHATSQGSPALVAHEGFVAGATLERARPARVDLDPYSARRPCTAHPGAESLTGRCPSQETLVRIRTKVLWRLGAMF